MTLRIPAAGGGSGGERELARGKSTRQSSDYRPGQGVSRLAVDGNTSGVWGNRSVTHTTGSASDMNPYWEVDLGASYKISRIEVYNRTDCCKERLNNFKILVDGREFVPGLQRYKAGQANPMTYRGNKTGRKVKIQISGRGIVSLAEVKVYGTPLSGGSTSGGTTKQVAGTTKQPSLGMNYIICLQGVYPSRN
ncbi:MAG: discoidin domain-containing protein [Bacteroidota bacterium]